MCVFLAYFLGVIAFFAIPCEAQGDRYFIAAQPGAGTIMYMREGDEIMRILMLPAAVALGPIAVDPTSAKLYVADKALAKIFWYQLIALPDKSLITDGRKHVAISNIVGQSMTCDGAGNLYIGGNVITAVTPSAPAPPLGIIKIAAMQLIQGIDVIPVPEGIWNTQNSGSPAKMFDPAGLQSDGARLFWGNGKQGGTHGTIVQASAGGGGAPSVLVDQGEAARAVGLSGESLFYSTENGIFGISLNKKESGCGAPAPPPEQMNPMQIGLKGGGQKGPCRLISSEIKGTVGMFWDGDGTMYTADPASGIYSFPSGNLEQHNVKQMVKISGLQDLEILMVGEKSIASLGSAPSVILIAISYVSRRFF